MVTYVQNKLIKVTIIVDISTVCVQHASKALFIRILRWKYTVHSLPACDVFHNPDSIFFIFFFMGGLCVVYVRLGQTSATKTQRI